MFSLITSKIMVWNFLWFILWMYQICLYTLYVKLPPSQKLSLKCNFKKFRMSFRGVFFYIAACPILPPISYLHPSPSLFAWNLSKFLNLCFYCVVRRINVFRQLIKRCNNIRCQKTQIYNRLTNLWIIANSFGFLCQFWFVMCCRTVDIFSASYIHNTMKFNITFAMIQYNF